MEELFKAIKSSKKENSKPLFIKISPDIERKEIESIVQVALDYNLAGIIGTNTTIDKTYGQGGMSGRVLENKAKEVREILLEVSKGTHLDIIGVGGISSFEDVWSFWKNGGKAFQVYTALIYQGPQLLKDIKDNIDLKLKQNNFKSLEELFQNINSI